METQDYNTKRNGIGLTNRSYISNPSFMTMRLDTKPLVADIKNFLESIEVNYKRDETTGQLYEDKFQVGLPMANPEGVMRLCNIVRMRVNHHVSQGNFKIDHYWDFIARARREVTETVIKKCYDWEIDDSNLNMIIDEICQLIEAFMTRPIDNKERDSYGEHFLSKENIIQDDRKGKLMNFGRGLGGGSQ